MDEVEDGEQELWRSVVKAVDHWCLWDWRDAWTFKVKLFVDSVLIFIQQNVNCHDEILFDVLLCDKSSHIIEFLIFPPQTLATSCRLPSSCWTPAFITPTSETSPQWSASSPWTEGSTRGGTSQRSYSGWDLISLFAWTNISVYCVSETTRS